MKFIFFCLCLFFTASFLSFSQSNKVIDEILESKEMDLYRAAYLLCFASEAGIEDDEPTAYIKALSEASDYFTDKKPEDPMSSAEFALSLMAMFKLKGGVMYTIFKNPRYAYRELVFKGIISKSVEPSAGLSGEEVLNIIQKALLWKEAYSN